MNSFLQCFIYPISLLSILRLCHGENLGTRCFAFKLALNCTATFTVAVLFLLPDAVSLLASRTINISALDLKHRTVCPFYFF